MTDLNISSEEFRVYTYPNGDTFRIDAPVTLWVLDTGSHRVSDKAGMVHRPERGWVGVSWKPADGSPRFVA